jgi:hypothetical protein
MTSGIKPPGAPGTPPNVSGPEAGGARPAGESFRAELEKTSEAGAPGGPAATARAETVRALAAEVRAGRITGPEAIERLVQRALASAGALPPARRAELEALLRSALEEDPTLASMQKDLARGR